MKTSRVLLPLFLAFSAGGAACASGDLPGFTSNPPGMGGFDPGVGANGPGSNGTGANGTGSGWSGTGASGPGTTGGGIGGSSTGGGGIGGSGTGGTMTTTTSETGTGGVVDPGPPSCDDSLKHCTHTFSYPAGNETSVDVRGNFAPNGWSSGVAMIKVGLNWQADVDVPWNTAVQYKFVINGSQWVNDPLNPSLMDDGYGGKNSLLAPETCTDWTCEQGPVTPPPPATSFDWRDAVLYFAFVDRFLDGNVSNNGWPTANVQHPADYQGGDWAGVKQKVDSGYFTALGVNVLWLSVPMDNTSDSGVGTDSHNYSGYHGYWPKDLDQAEEHFGTTAELKALVDAAHGKGIKVILDYAMNHVHQSALVYAQHPDWFWPHDVNGQSCVCGSSACAWEGPNAKRCWFTDYLPDFNFTVAAARQYSVDNAMSWIKQTGIDGFRLDAVKHIEDQWLLDLRARVTAEIESTSGQHFYMVGETYTGDSALIKYYVKPSMLDGQFDFPLRARLIRSVLMRLGGGSDVMSSLEGFLAYNDTYYGAGVMSTFIGNQDVPRSIHFAEDNPAWGNEWSDGKDRAWNNLPGQPGGTSAYDRLCNAFTILYTSRGVPLVYYGDEVGMAGAGDPDNRRMMQWTGYSSGQQHVLDHLKKLGAIRAAHPALRKGTRASFSSTSETLVYKMSLGTDVVYMAMNRSDSVQTVSGLPAGTLQDALTSTTVSGPSFAVPARSAMILTGP